ncbi:MAG: PfkB family carbohydrate kinase [Flavisolibacter sp.]
MQNIVTITFNPCIDKSTKVYVIEADIKMKCSSAVFEPGGGGINLARVIKRLGEAALALFPDSKV